MNRNNIKKIIEDLQDITEKYTDDEFNVAVYIFARYGKYEFDNYICDDELEQINQVLKRHSTLFDEDINDYVELILNNAEELED